MFNFNELNFDFNGDGVLDSHAEFMDLDNDEIADCLYDYSCRCRVSDYNKYGEHESG